MNNNDPITSNNSNTTNRVLQIIYQFEILTWYEEVIVSCSHQDRQCTYVL